MKLTVCCKCSCTLPRGVWGGRAMALAPRPWCRTPPAGHGAAGELSPMVPACWVGCSALGTAPWSGTLPSLWGDGELDTWRVHTYTAPSLPCCCLCCVAVLHRGGDGCQGWAPCARSTGRPWCCSLAVSGGREPHAQHQRSPAPLLRALFSPADGFCSDSCFV